jgi:hypothetical protein
MRLEMRLSSSSDSSHHVFEVRLACRCHVIPSSMLTKSADKVSGISPATMNLPDNTPDLRMVEERTVTFPSFPSSSATPLPTGNFPNTHQPSSGTMRQMLQVTEGTRVGWKA